MNRKPTYQEQAEDYSLWGEYVDPEGTVTEVEFGNLTVKYKVQMIVDMFGQERKSEAFTDSQAE